MGININSIESLAKRVGKYTEYCGVKSILHTKPTALKEINLTELKLIKTLGKDIFCNQKIKNIVNTINETETMEVLKNSGFKECSGYGDYPDGIMYKLLSEKERINIKKTCSEPMAFLIKSMKERPLSLSDISKIKELLNLSNGKYIPLFKENVDDFVYFYKTIQDSGYLHKYGKTLMPLHLDLLTNVVKSKCSLEAQEALNMYKGSSSVKINEALTTPRWKKRYLDSNVKSMIDNMSSYIETQVIKEPTKVYRSEGYEVLKSIKCLKGNRLHATLAEASKRANNGDFELVNRVINEVKNHKFNIIQKRFMSTSMIEDVNINNNIKWELEVPAGSKGVALDAINVSGLAVGEHELLLQKGSQINITDIDYKAGVWHLKGIVNN